MAKHRLFHAKRRDGDHTRMAGRLLVVVTMENRRVAVLAPKALAP